MNASYDSGQIKRLLEPMRKVHQNAGLHTRKLSDNRESKPSKVSSKRKKSSIVKVSSIEIPDNPESNYYTNASSPKATSVSSTSSSVKRQRKKTQESNMINLNFILEEMNKDLFTFTNYLHVLRRMKLIGEGSLSKQEEGLVTKSWHQISFFHECNIVTNSQNIRIFISGVLGITEEWMYTKVGGG